MEQLTNTLENLTIEDKIMQIDMKNKVLVEIFDNIEQIIQKNTNLKEKEILKCLENKKLTHFEFGWCYMLKFIDMENFIKSKKPGSIKIKDAYPHLRDEFDQELNPGIIFDELTIGSTVIIKWKCPIHGEFESAVKNRVNNNCMECYHDKIRKFNIKDKEEYKNEHRDTNINSIKIGDDTEEYVVDLLKETKQFKDIIKTGQTSEKCDIKVILLDGTEKGLQVKTLSIKLDRTDSYCTGSLLNYDSDMLIVMVNKNRDRFALEFVKNITTKKLYLTFSSSRKTKYDNIMFKDKNLFIKKLVELIPLSIDYKLDLGIMQQKEYNMLERLENYCIKNNLSYIRNDSNGNSIDCFINNFKCQAKYCSLNVDGSSTYNIHFSKRLGNNYIQPYHCNDFDYFIVELGGVRNSEDLNDLIKYHNYFCIIPNKELVEQEALQSETCNGKITLGICPPNYPKDHWSKKYWRY